MSRTVLIVDDSEFVRNYHSAILREANFQVITAGDGMEGLERLFTNRCDLVLTDINMQRMDGYEFTRRVRSEKQYQQLPIVIISTESRTNDRKKGFEAGANLYIVKPCSPEVMLETLKMIMNTPSSISSTATATTQI
jgi:two-component system chemotaxis response regulator CheY